MGIVNKKEDGGGQLPGSSGLHVDLDLRVCPECRTEALPWQETCPQCGVAPVPQEQLTASSFPLPAHLLEGLDEPDDEPGTPDADG